jgi:WD40 repeat protein
MVIWDTFTGAQLAALTGPTDGARMLKVAPDGSWMAATSFRTIVIWDIATGTQRAILAGHTNLVTALAISPDGSWLASTGDDRSVRIWDIATGWRHAMTRIEQSASTCFWTPDGRSIAVGGPAGLHLFNFHPGTKTLA